MSSSEESDDEAFESADEDIHEDIHEDVDEDIDEQLGHETSHNEVIINRNAVKDETLEEDTEEHNLNRVEQTFEVNQNQDFNLDEEKNELSKKIDKQLKIVENLNNNESNVSQTSTFDNELPKNTNQSISSEIDFKFDENLSENKNQPILENTNEDKSTEQTIIKGRKLLRKSDRIKTEEEETSVSDDKKSEVLNKLANISVPNNSRWNSWLTDIKSAAVSATSTTVSHASNWSLNPKSILTSAATLTSQVVENVGSVVDSAIGAPTPEQMAELIKKDKGNEKNEKNDNQNETKSAGDQQNNENASNSSKFSLGFVDYTLNTLELIGKKTMEVIGDDNSKDNKQK